MALVLMLLLLFRGPTFTTDSVAGKSADVDCGTILTAGSPGESTYLQAESYFNQRTFTIEGGPEQLTNTQVIGVFQECNERRATYLTYLVLLAVPFTVLITMLLVSRPAARRTPRSRNNLEGGVV